MFRPAVRLLRAIKGSEKRFTRLNLQSHPATLITKMLRLSEPIAASGILFAKESDQITDEKIRFLLVQLSEEVSQNQGGYLDHPEK